MPRDDGFTAATVRSVLRNATSCYPVINISAFLGTGVLESVWGGGYICLSWGAVGLWLVRFPIEGRTDCIDVAAV